MSTHDIQIPDRIRKCLNICFLELSEEFRSDLKTSSSESL